LEIKFNMKFGVLGRFVSPFYYSSELLAFTDSKETLPVDSVTGRVPLVIVARHHYLESTQCYPIKNLYHLYKVIKAEVAKASLIQQKLFWSITGKNESGYVVTYWQIACALTDRFDKCTFVVPESYLLALYARSSGHRILATESDVLFFLGDEGKQFSTFKSPLVPTVERFLELSGVVEPEPVHMLSNEEYLRVISCELDNLSLYQLIGLYNPKQEKLSQINWLNLKWPATVFCSSLALYASFVSFYQEYQLGVVQSEISTKQELISEISMIELKVKEIESSNQYYNRLNDNYPGAILFYQLLHPALMETETRLTNFRLNGNVAKIYGLAPSATKVLEMLVNIEEFSSVKLDGTVTTARSGNERFVIELVLKNEAVLTSGVRE